MLNHPYRKPCICPELIIGQNPHDAVNNILFKTINKINTLTLRVFKSNALVPKCYYVNDYYYSNYALNVWINENNKINKVSFFSQF